MIVTRLDACSHDAEGRVVIDTILSRSWAKTRWPEPEPGCARVCTGAELLARSEAAAVQAIARALRRRGRLTPPNVRHVVALAAALDIEL